MNSDENDNFDLSEDALRQALDRLGKGRSSSAPQMSRQVTERSGGATGGGHHSFDHAQRRRRFVQDGEVVVERQALARNGRVSAAPQTNEDHAAELDRAADALKREQRRREDIERQLHEAQLTIRSLETRAGHADMRLAEMARAVERSNEELATLKARARSAEGERDSLTDANHILEMQVARLSEIEVQAEPVVVTKPRRDAAPRAAATRRPGRPAAPPAPVADIEEDEPEPVKWWIKKKA